MIRTALSLVLLCASASFDGCKSCNNDPPPILFRGGGDAQPQLPMPTTTPDASASDASSDAAGPAAISQTDVSGDGASFTVAGVTQRAPSGSRYTATLAIDVDNDGDDDVATVVTRAGAAAKLVFYRREPAGFEEVRATGADAPNVDCVSATLRTHSKRAVVVHFDCSARGDAGAPLESAHEWVVVALTANSAIGRLRVSQAAPLPTDTALTIDPVVSDRDGDGSDDVAVVLGARRASEPLEKQVTATVALIDRGGSYARDTTEPAASLNRAAAAIRSLAGSRRTAPEALASVERFVRLRRALCAEALAPRVRIGGELGLHCAGVSAFLTAAEAQARALLSLGEYPAVEALQRADTASELGVVTNERIDTDLIRATASEPVTARQGSFVGASADAAMFARVPSLVLDGAGVNIRGLVHARVDLTMLSVTPGEVGTSTELQPRSADGQRVLQGFFWSCEGLIASTCAGSDVACASAPLGAEPPPSATIVNVYPLASPEFSARCIRREAAYEAITRLDGLRVAGFSRDALVIAYRGRLLRAGPTDRAFTPLGATTNELFPAGSMASANGRWITLPSANALYVRDAQGRWHAWKPPQLAGRFRQLNDTTISDDGRLVAALLGTQLWVLERAELAAAAAPARR